MGNWKLTRSQEPQALTEPVLREMRSGRSGGISRRQLIRRSIGAATALWILEVSAGTLGFLWPNLARGFGGVINELYNTELGNMTNLLLVIDRIWTWLFLGGELRRSFLGFYTTNIPLWLAWATLLGLGGLCVLALRRKIKAYEVVR